MEYKSFVEVSNGITITKRDDSKIRFEAWGNNVVRISCTKTNFIENQSLIVNATPWNPNYTVEEDNNRLTFKTQDMRIVFNKQDGKLSYFRQDGTFLVKEDRFGIELEQREIDVPTFVKDGNIVGKMKCSQIKKIEGYKVRLRFAFEEDEVLYGLGSSDLSTFNRKECDNFLFQHNYKAPVPFLVSPKGYGILVDTCSYSTFRKDELGYCFYCEANDMCDFYFICADNLDGVIDGYRKLTGSAPMLPKWFFGYAQSKERYKTQEELLEVVKEYRKRSIPLDLIIQDWHYWRDDVWSDKSFDKERFPDPTRMCEEVHSKNAHIMISVWPNTRNGENQKELWENNNLLGDGEVYNVFDEKACTMYWNQINNGIVSHGFDALWCDCSEPYEGGFLENHIREREEYMAAALSLFRKYIDNRKINAFSLLHCKNIYENHRKASDEKRVVNLTRSGYAGQQRYSGIAWSGDITASWKTLKEQIGEGLNFCASGLPYWTLDIGGFFVFFNNENKYKMGALFQEKEDLGYHELYTRWLQYGCFLPMFRSHGTDLAREAWQFGDKGSMFYDTIKKFIELRYRLIPYLYSLSAKITMENYTLMRLLAFDFAHDKKTHSICDQYMFGTALMVCPVTEPMYYNPGSVPIASSAKCRKVYLPDPNMWYDYWTGDCFCGGKEILSDAPIEKMPIYVKAGSIIPTSPVMQYVDENKDAPYEIYIYPGGDADFTLYEDEGDGYAYEDNEAAVYTISWYESEQKINVSQRRGSFNGLIKTRLLKFIVVGVGEQEAVYEGNNITLKF